MTDNTTPRRRVAGGYAAGRPAPTPRPEPVPWPDSSAPVSEDEAAQLTVRTRLARAYNTEEHSND